MPETLSTTAKRKSSLESHNFSSLQAAQNVYRHLEGMTLLKLPSPTMKVPQAIAEGHPCFQSTGFYLLITNPVLFYVYISLFSTIGWSIINNLSRHEARASLPTSLQHLCMALCPISNLAWQHRLIAPGPTWNILHIQLWFQLYEYLTR